MAGAALVGVKVEARVGVGVRVGIRVKVRVSFRVRVSSARTGRQRLRPWLSPTTHVPGGSGAARASQAPAASTAAQRYPGACCDASRASSARLVFEAGQRAASCTRVRTARGCGASASAPAPVAVAAAVAAAGSRR
eukprot:scaffold53978_cov63-Phaeocystis_antarctica.AAC.3